MVHSRRISARICAQNRPPKTETHTPSPMGFLSEILGRPPNERAYVVIPVGHPAEEATVPAVARKSLREVMVEIPTPPG